LPPDPSAPRFSAITAIASAVHALKARTARFDNSSPQGTPNWGHEATRPRWPCVRDQFVVWGWRIPFALSIILVGIGLWIRLGILETPVFQQLLDTNKIEKAPISEVIKKQPKEIILSAFLRLSEQAPFYIFTAFIFAYAVGTLHMSRDLILSAVMVAACVSFVSIPLSGHISDRIGRRRMYLIGVVATGLFGFLYFGMVDTANPWAVFIAIVL
jgi:MFS family permease